MRYSSRDDGIGCFIVGAIGILAFWGVVAYIVIHFISKLW